MGGFNWGLRACARVGAERGRGVKPWEDLCASVVFWEWVGAHRAMLLLHAQTMRGRRNWEKISGAASRPELKNVFGLVKKEAGLWFFFLKKQNDLKQRKIFEVQESGSCFYHIWLCSCNKCTDVRNYTHAHTHTQRCLQKERPAEALQMLASTSFPVFTCWNGVSLKKELQLFRTINFKCA